ncbi:MAG: tetratricopeptide repeat protein [Paludibacteraceae bacterium]|nr:tetratricopeptide repeat protein [Paludibacteraceae bacterium]
MNKLIILLTFFAPLALFGASMENAAALYTSGDYDGCVKEYNEILDGGMESATLYYNLGNAHFRLGQMAQAILNYERALKLDPANADIKHNLEFAKEKTIDKIDAPETIFLERWWNDIVNLATADVWAYWSVGLFALFIAALLCYIFSRTLWLRKSGFAIAVTSLFFTIITFVFAYQQNAVKENSSYAIIFAPTVTIKSTPDVSGTDLFILHEGTKVQVIEAAGSWVEIITEDGSKGWLNAEAIEII